MNLASFYLCLFVNFKCFSKAILWNAISRETEDNYKYLVALYTHHFRERFTFCSLFCCKSFFRALYVFIHTRLLRVNTVKSSDHGGDISNPESGIDNCVTNAHEELLTITWYAKIKKLFVVDNISPSQFIFHFILSVLISFQSFLEH